MSAGDCTACKDLLDLASAATARHIEAVGRLQIANILQDHDQIPSLEEQVRQARRAREQATSAYKHHESTHRVMCAGGAA